MAVSKSVAPRFVMGLPIRAAQSFPIRVAQSRDKCANVAVVDVVRLDELIEVGVDPTILPAYEQDDDARRRCRKQLAQSLSMIWSDVLRGEHDRFSVRSPVLEKFGDEAGRIERAHIDFGKGALERQ